MSGQLEVGSVVEGKVTGIKPFGAFVAIDEEKQGLVHISQVAHGFVKDINDHLSVGDEVKVKVMSIDSETGKISLSIRETVAAPEKPARPAKPRVERPRKVEAATQEKSQGFNTLEEKLKGWLKQSNEIQADLNKRTKK
ncbi:general stress protein 13 [Anaerobacillus sp. CMMVII]|uniref:S1 domain-containing post-transcriptional regulator GSP13 n=1 Tax=Anaerobacillus sp. CMMVII TaxID=2755588 RepID=UPI0021B819EF|nr:S1 domain-containing post-transcriptional regulator GSP13 [Anaerobacillus sp. CMMVII]MCT8140484.1 general stress protein 13 [Anaerobacillus sp. CMMVII]